MTKPTFDYVKKRAELDALLAWFEQDDIAIDEAIAKYNKADVIVKELEQYLGDTQAKIEQLTKRVDVGK